MIIPEKAFAGLSVMVVGDLLQLPPVRGNLIFSRFPGNYRIKRFISLAIMSFFYICRINWSCTVKL